MKKGTPQFFIFYFFKTVSHHIFLYSTSVSLSPRLSQRERAREARSGNKESLTTEKMLFVESSQAWNGWKKNRKNKNDTPFLKTSLLHLDDPLFQKRLAVLEHLIRSLGLGSWFRAEALDQRRQGRSEQVEAERDEGLSLAEEEEEEVEKTQKKRLKGRKKNTIICARIHSLAGRLRLDRCICVASRLSWSSGHSNQPRTRTRWMVRVPLRPWLDCFDFDFFLISKAECFSFFFSLSTKQKNIRAFPIALFLFFENATDRRGVLRAHCCS